MDPRLTDLVDDVAEYHALATEIAEREVELAAVKARLAGKISGDMISSFRAEFSSTLIVVQSAPAGIPVLPIVDWYDAAQRARSWPMRGVVRTAATLEVAADILEDCWDVRTRLEVPLGPLLDGERGLYRPIQANYLLAAPTPTVAAILRDAGDPRFAHVGATRLSFRLPKERKEAEDAE